MLLVEKDKSQRVHKKISVLLVNHTLVMEIAVLFPDLLYKPMAVGLG